MFPVFTCDDLRLSVHDFFCGASLALLQLLPDAGDHTQVALQSVGHLRPTEPELYLLLLYEYTQSTFPASSLLNLRIFICYLWN